MWPNWRSGGDRWDSDEEGGDQGDRRKGGGGGGGGGEASWMFDRFLGESHLCSVISVCSVIVSSIGHKVVSP